MTSRSDCGHVIPVPHSPQVRMVRIADAVTHFVAPSTVFPHAGHVGSKPWLFDWLRVMACERGGGEEERARRRSRPALRATTEPIQSSSRTTSDARSGLTRRRWKSA